MAKVNLRGHLGYITGWDGRRLELSGGRQPGRWQWPAAAGRPGLFSFAGASFICLVHHDGQSPHDGGHTINIQGRGGSSSSEAGAAHPSWSSLSKNCSYLRFFPLFLFNKTIQFKSVHMDKVGKYFLKHFFLSLFNVWSLKQFPVKQNLLQVRNKTGASTFETFTSFFQGSFWSEELKLKPFQSQSALCVTRQRSLLHWNGNTGDSFP